MARGELMQKLLSSYGHDDEFRAVANQIIDEEEKKNNRVLAKTLRRSLEGGSKPMSKPKALAPLLPFPEKASEFVERVETTRTRNDIVLSADNAKVLLGLEQEFRNADAIRRHGLHIRSKLLFCGPPGCGKTMCAEVFSRELGMPLFVVKLDRLVSSYLGETAANVRQIFEFARKQPCVLFLDEFDAIARSREDGGEHNELRRVVNSLLLFIDRIEPWGFLIAATNLDQALDPAVWRRFDEVLWFEKPIIGMLKRYLKVKFRNVKVDFEPQGFATEFMGLSFSDAERACNQAIKMMIINRQKLVYAPDVMKALRDEQRRSSTRN